MEVRVRVQFASGEYDWWNNVIQDLNGCGPDWVEATAPLTNFSGRNVSRSQAQLWATEDGVPFVKVAQSTWKEDPNG